MKKYYAIIAVAICLSACSSQKTQSTAQNLQTNEAQNQNTVQNLQSNQVQNAEQQKDLSFENTKWMLKTIDGKEIKERITPAYIVFNDSDLVTGNSGCNGFSGSFYLSGDILKLSNMISTKRACLGENIESMFFSVLNRVDACLIIGNKLTFTQMGEEIATFEGVEK